MARQPGLTLHHELVLIDQSQLRQRQRELHAAHEQSLTRFPLELLNGFPQISAHELRVPIDPFQDGGVGGSVGCSMTSAIMAATSSTGWAPGNKCQSKIEMSAPQQDRNVLSE
jgi:hypothetical protein